MHVHDRSLQIFSGENGPKIPFQTLNTAEEAAGMEDGAWQIKGRTDVCCKPKPAQIKHLIGTAERSY